MKKTAVGALLAGIIVLGLSAPAAQAATRNVAGAGNARFGQTFCLFEDSNFKRGHYCVNPPKKGTKEIKLSGKRWAATSRSANNAATSMRNYTKCEVWLYDTPDGRSKRYWAQSNSEDASFRNNRFSDKASVIWFVCE